MSEYPVITAGLHYTLAPAALVLPYVEHIPVAVSVAVGVFALIFYVLQIIDWVEKRVEKNKRSRKRKTK